MPRRELQYTATINTCCHWITLRYWDFKHELTPELEETLKEHGEERARECIAQDICSGELNCLYYDEDSDTEEEIRGAWEIDREV